MGGLAKSERAVPESVSVSGRVGEMRCVRPDEGSLPQRSLNPTSQLFFFNKNYLYSYTQGQKPTNCLILCARSTSPSNQK